MYVQEIQRIPLLWTENRHDLIRETLARKEIADNIHRGLEWTYWNHKLGINQEFTTIESENFRGFGLALNTQGTRVAVSDLREAGVWDVRTGRSLWKHLIGTGDPWSGGRHGWHNGVMFSPDGRLVAAISREDQRIFEIRPKSYLRIWDAESGVQKFAVEADREISGRAAGFSPNGQWIVADGDPWKAWNIRSHEMVQGPPSVSGIRQSVVDFETDATIPNIAFFGDGTMFANSRRDIWRLNGELYRSGNEFRGPVEPVDYRCVFPAVSEPMVCEVGKDNSLVAKTGHTSTKLHTGYVWSLAASEGDVAIGCNDKIVRLWEPEAAVKREFRGSQGPCSVAVSRAAVAAIDAEGRTIVWPRSKDVQRKYEALPIPDAVALGKWGDTSGVHNGVDLWSNAEPANRAARVRSRDGKSYSIPIRGAPPFPIVRSPDGKLLAFVYNQHSTDPPNRPQRGPASTIEVWRLGDAAPILSKEFAESAGGSFDRSGTRFACRVSSVGVLIFDLTTGKIISQFPSSEAHFGYCFSPSGKTVVIGEDESFSVYNVDSGALLHQRRPGAILYGIDRTGRWIVASHYANSPQGQTMFLLDLEDPEESRVVLPSLDVDIHAIAVTKNQQRLVVQTDDGLFIASVNDGAILAEIPTTEWLDLFDVDTALGAVAELWTKGP
ncbi:WD40 repeat domain-containing protein [Planctomyces sp. SH-PL14]|uniref:WD40 repeat domain-containing protein n=1 Tax=Planctomyces sp. SH-PL14 TaxID=1632864 RepID=UPI00078D5FD3|nr:hypothetical protein [Planctomyces sp. SH-PL14]AMV18437.1 hypothetical protein VT03_11135 [Planctomyces sp. SH-PL14]